MEIYQECGKKVPKRPNGVNPEGIKWIGKGWGKGIRFEDVIRRCRRGLWVGARGRGQRTAREDRWMKSKIDGGRGGENEEGGGGLEWSEQMRTVGGGRHLHEGEIG